MTPHAQTASLLRPTDPVDRLAPSDPLILPLLRLRVYTLGDLARVPRWRLARHSCPAGLGDRLLVLQQQALKVLGGQPQVPLDQPWQAAMPHLPGRVRTLLRGMDSLGEVREAVAGGLLGNGRLQAWERDALLDALAAAGWPDAPETSQVPSAPPPSPPPVAGVGQWAPGDPQAPSAPPPSPPSGAAPRQVRPAVERRAPPPLLLQRQRRAPSTGVSADQGPAAPLPGQGARRERAAALPGEVSPRLSRQIYARLQARGVPLLAPWHVVLPPLPLRITRTLTQKGLVNVGAVAQALDSGALVGLPNFGEESRRRLRRVLLHLAEDGSPEPPRTVGALVAELLAACPKRERELLTSHFHEGKSLTALAAERGVTRQRVRQILVRVLRRWQPRYQLTARTLLAPLRAALRGGALVDRQTVKRMLGGEEVSLGSVALALYLTEPSPRARVWRQRYLTEQRRQVDRVQLRRIRLALRRRRRARLPLTEVLTILRRELGLALTEEGARALLWRGLCLPTNAQGRVVLQSKS